MKGVKKLTLILDGTRMAGLEAFWDEVSRSLVPGARWGCNLDAFNDILRGGFGTPEGGFILRWTASAIARETLGYDATLEYLETTKLKGCHPTWVATVLEEIAAAQRREGPTLFDYVVAIIREHGPGGVEPADGVDLVFMLCIFANRSLPRRRQKMPIGSLPLVGE